MKNKKAEMERLREKLASVCAAEFPESAPVFGEGPVPCRLMVIGEAPGRDETRLGRPFVGKAGSFFIGVFERALGMKRNEAYITNVLKVWPRIETKRLKTRKPMKEEEVVFTPFLLEEIELVDPTVIVAVGKVAFFALMPGEAFKAGQWMSFDGRHVMPVYHPSYLLRQQRRLAESTKELENELIEAGARLKG